ncbi:MAG: Hpt domain-containing protein [Vicinamibacterales bacterium]
MIEDTQIAFDAEEVCRWYDNDLEAIQELVDLVQNDLPRYVRALEDAADAGDLQTVGRFAHTIKGAVSNVCALRLCGVTEALEMGARGGDVSRVAALRPEFRANVTALLTELDQWVSTQRPSAVRDGYRG